MKRSNNEPQTNENKRVRDCVTSPASYLISSGDSNDSTLSSCSSNNSVLSATDASTIPTTFPSSMPLLGLFGNSANRNTFPRTSTMDSIMCAHINGHVGNSVLQFPSSTIPSMNVNTLELNGQNSNQTDSLGRSSSPLPVFFSSDDAKNVSDMMKERNLASLQKAVKILIGWLKNGQCNKSNNNEFLDMITCAHNQVWRCMSEKTEAKEHLFEERREISKSMSNLYSQFNEIVRVLDTAHVKKVWDHFTKPQRRNISLWKDYTTEIKSSFSDEIDDNDDEEVTSTTNNNPQKSPESTDDDDSVELEEEWKKLNDEKASIANQLETKMKEVDKLRMENEKKDSEQKKSVAEYIENIKELDLTIKTLKKFKVDAILSQNSNENRENHFTSQPAPKSCLPSDKNHNVSGVQISGEELGYITLISVFLYVHPFGASIDYICSYLSQASTKASDTRYIESLMRKFPHVFKEKSSGIGATLVKDWIFLGLQ